MAKKQLSTGFRRPGRVVFTGDFLRPNYAGQLPTQHHNIRWLQNLLSTQVSMATGLPVSSVNWNAAGVQDGLLTGNDVTRIYRMFGLPVSLDSWAMIHGSDQLPAAVEAMLRALFHDALVVGFEMSPALEMFFIREGIAYVQAAVHPVRFLDDLLLAFRSNVPEIQSALARHLIDEAHILTMAGVQKASAGRGFNDPIEPGSALFLMQTWYDQSQIENGRFRSTQDFITEIVRYAAMHREFLVKEHPLAPNPATPIMAALIPNMRLVNANVYALMSRPEIVSVGTLSSSVGLEAGYFGKNTRYFLREPMDLLKAGDDRNGAYVGIQDAFLCPDFWRTVLAPVVAVTKEDGVVVPFKPNRLRTSIRSFWNFNEIDTDVAVQAAKAR